MSETPGSERPEGDDGRRRAPYPGWSVEQPPRGWTAPDAAGPGWTSHGQQPGAGQPDAGQPAGSQPGGWRQGQPAQPGQAGWGTGPGWAWAAPTVKPGVIPLRPLGIGEILDGAVTTIRRNPGPMLGLSAIVAVITQLVGLVASWIVVDDLVLLDRFASAPEGAATDAVVDSVNAVLTSSSVVLAVMWIAMMILTGILAVVVGRAVLGQRLGTAETWAMARPRLLRLLLLTLVFALIVLAPFVGTLLFGLLVTASGAGAAGLGLTVLLGIAAIPLTIWLYVRYTLAAPALMLESTPTAGRGGSRPIGIGLALRRSAELVQRSWWRAFGILLLIGLIVLIVGQVLQVPFTIPYLFIDMNDPETFYSLEMLALSALGGIVSTTIVAPFLAAAIALLYVDRRIRREGLDIDLARAAGVTIPGRTDQPPPGR